MKTTSLNNQRFEEMKLLSFRAKITTGQRVSYHRAIRRYRYTVHAAAVKAEKTKTAEEIENSGIMI